MDSRKKKRKKKHGIMAKCATAAEVFHELNLVPKFRGQIQLMIGPVTRPINPNFENATTLP